MFPHGIEATSGQIGIFARGASKPKGGVLFPQKGGCCSRKTFFLALCHLGFLGVIFLKTVITVKGAHAHAFKARAYAKIKTPRRDGGYGGLRRGAAPNPARELSSLDPSLRYRCAIAGRGNSYLAAQKEILQCACALLAKRLKTAAKRRRGLGTGPQAGHGAAAPS